MRSVTLNLTEPQCFALALLLEGTLASADQSRWTVSYAAVLRKLRALEKVNL